MWDRGAVWLARFSVKEEVTGSNPVGPAMYQHTANSFQQTAFDEERFEGWICETH